MNNNIHNDLSKIQEATKTVFDCLEDKLAKDIVVLNINAISPLADYFVIATGNSDSHLKTLADEIEKHLSKLGIALRHKEGYNSGKWILLDFGSIILHLFSKEERSFYNLERIWGDAEQVYFSESII